MQLLLFLPVLLLLFSCGSTSSIPPSSPSVLVHDAGTAADPVDAGDSEASSREIRAVAREGLGGCAFDPRVMAFAGTPVEQARCLLRQVRPKGAGAISQPLPPWLAARMGEAVTVTPAGLESYLRRNGIDPGDVATSSAGAMTARYFVIHDTSAPEITEASGFPSNMDKASYGPNNLANYSSTLARRVNLIIARDGGSRFFQAWGATRSLPATKLENSGRAPASRPLFVHVENVQPRLRPAGSWAWIAPKPGFSAAQEERLALAYIAASVAARRWLVPAFHFTIDENFPDVHDDPQNFDLPGWVARVAALEGEMQG